MQWCLDVRSNIIADDVVQHQNKRPFQRKPDKQHHLYSVWPITLYNSSKYVSRVSLCKCEDDYCRWHSATCTFSHSNPERTAPLFNCSLLRNVLITHCIELFGYFGASLQQKRCDC
ncbi:hypothetical protein T06_10938 [Trichinella sp. T6]|nr:hypothetical protein T06_10938 [Trichinella sp. T6]